MKWMLIKYIFFDFRFILSRRRADRIEEFRFSLEVCT